MTYRATVLVQAADPRPGAALELAAALADVRDVVQAVPTIGAYDALVTIEATSTRGIGSAAVRLQQHDDVGRTLTLAHLTERPETE